MGNNPVSFIDPDGGFTDFFTAISAWVKGGFWGKIHRDKSGVRKGEYYISGNVNSNGADGAVVNHKIIYGDNYGTYPLGAFQGSITSPEQSFFKAWEGSNDFLAKTTYQMADNFYLGFQSSPIGAPFYDKSERRHLSGYLADQQESEMALINTFISLSPMGEIKLIPKMNAASFSKTFQGNLAGFSAKNRGTIIKTSNWISTKVHAKMFVKQMLNKGEKVNNSL